jgi:hypothetical protein
MVRGIDKMSIFKDNGDKEKFLQRLGENIDKGSAFVYAWAVMDNHTSPKDPSPELLQGLSLVCCIFMTFSI